MKTPEHVDASPRNILGPGGKIVFSSSNGIAPYRRTAITGPGQRMNSGGAKTAASTLDRLILGLAFFEVSK